MQRWLEEGKVYLTDDELMEDILNYLGVYDKNENVAVLDSAPRSAGMQSGDRWDGRNGAGLVVRNGVYVAELTAVYADGRTERSIRKVAVVR